MKALAKQLLRRRLDLLDRTGNYYRDETDPGSILTGQIQAFQQTWKRCMSSIPFYKMWAQENRLPPEVRSIAELREFPPITKDVIREHRSLIFQLPSDSSVSTGGSTGVPAVFPSGKEDGDSVYADLYTGRGWWGLKPLDRMVLLWGHSHLFGTGFSGSIKQMQRRITDGVLNMHRLNAYDMTPETVEKYYREICKIRPKYIVGYTNCLFKLATFAQRNSMKFPPIKAVIATSETVTDADIDVIGKAFQAPVVLEYGMAETGVIAYSRNESRNVQIFYGSFIATCNNQNDLFVSTIAPRRFPLIQYQTEDKVQIRDTYQDSILSLSGISGRSKETLIIRSMKGTEIHISGILIVHALKRYPDLYSIQFEQKSEAEIQILVTSRRRLNLTELQKYFLSEISKDHPDVDPAAITFVQLTSPVKSLAGKENMIVSITPAANI